MYRDINNLTHWQGLCQVFAMKFRQSEVDALGIERCQKIAKKIREAIDHSFAKRPMKGPDTKERKRRTELAEIAWRMMTYEIGLESLHACNYLKMYIVDIIDKTKDSGVERELIQPVTDLRMVPLDLHDRVEAEQVLTALSARKGNARSN
jgi:hypothetical protein